MSVYAISSYGLNSLYIKESSEKKYPEEVPSRNFNRLIEKK